VIFQITLDELLINTSLQSIVEDFVFVPLHLPHFPLHLVKSTTPLALAYVNPATPLDSRFREEGGIILFETDPQTKHLVSHDGNPSVKHSPLLP
jgi:hypothetical protein